MMLYEVSFRKFRNVMKISVIVFLQCQNNTDFSIRLVRTKFCFVIDPRSLNMSTLIGRKVQAKRILVEANVSPLF